MPRKIDVDLEDPEIVRFMRKDDRQIRHFLKAINFTAKQIRYVLECCEEDNLDGIARKNGAHWFCGGDDLRQWLQNHPLK